MSGTSKVVDVCDLWVHYGDLAAVRGVDLSIGPGQVFGLIGPNGAGKTSTLLCLAGINEPSRGSIRIAGVDVLAEPSRAKTRIGFMPDFFGVYDNLQVWEYLEFFGTAMGVPSQDLATRMDVVLDATRLVDKREALVETLSRGMRQRLCLARALIHDPPVLLLDEPVSGLDPIGRVEVLELLRRLCEEGKTVVLSSHILSDLAEVSTSVGVLEQGVLVASGNVDQVRRGAMATRRLRLKLLAGTTDPLAGVLGGHPEVSRWAADAGLLEVDVSDDDEATSRVLEALTTAGVRWIPAPTTRDLEEAFLRLAKGTLS